MLRSRMGFFDSFKKKEEGNVNVLINSSSNVNSPNANFVLPPPPLPKKHVEFENKNSNLATTPPAPHLPTTNNFSTNPTSSNLPPQQIVRPLPLPPSTPFPVPPVFQETKKQEFNLMPPVEQKQNYNQTTFDTKLSFEEKEKKDTSTVPGFLPLMPPVRPQTKNYDASSIPSFEITKDNIPSFSIEEENYFEKESETLPTLEIFDSEEEISRIDFRHSALKKPLFIRTDYFSQVLSTIDSIKEYVTVSPEIIYGLENLKKNIDIENRNYKNSLEDIQRKLIYIDKVLFEKEG